MTVNMLLGVAAFCVGASRLEWWLKIALIVALAVYSPSAHAVGTYPKRPVRVFPKHFKHKTSGRCQDQQGRWLKGCK
jgi:hypothetical protein